ncbi:hypothetical protein C453_12901 [Haloferax elongans ATCC BAA-1513]|uniref:Uncharacterized protein n=1 Tax=Haloferax elongans ATCC BAA-1513 TaxID=1230453 RepID=M0HIS1_HALEO|nr:hypothetical protein [Haloferax elongans]ELZ84445.1 hypothetical protein C453_12901 [Haloferax elongans ATCC BAA-1513]
MSTRERRVTLALKWHHLDNLSAREIRDRFEEEGIGDYTRSTIRNYLNEKPKDEVLKQIEKKHADVRLQSAERYEELYQEARRDLETLAVGDDPVIAMVPKMELHQGDEDKRVSNWTFLAEDDPRRPEWATEHDRPIAFVDGVKHIQSGDEYPAGADRGGPPEYREAVVGLRRDQPDLQKRQFARREMAGYQDQKVEVLGGPDELNVNVDGEVDHNHGVDEATQEIIEDLADDLKA